MRWILPILLVLPCWPQPCPNQVLFQDVSQRLNREAIGGKDFGIWTVTISGRLPYPVSKAEILMLAPAIRSLPPRQSVIFLERAVYGDRRSAAVRVLSGAIQLAPMALSIAGVMTGSPGYSWSAAGIAGLNLSVPVLKRKAPDPNLIASSELLPETITGPGTWFLVASLMHGAKPIGPICLPIFQSTIPVMIENTK